MTTTQGEPRLARAVRTRRRRKVPTDTLIRFACILLLANLCLVTACVAGTPANRNLHQACVSAPVDQRIALLHIEGKRVSACPPGDDEGCPFSGRDGGTSLDDTPDLNNDGHLDAMLTHYGSSYGDIDVTDRLVLAQCADGTYIRLLEGRFTTLAAPETPHGAWPDLIATRDCPINQEAGIRTETIHLQFDRATMQYRGPIGLDLANACTD